MVHELPPEELAFRFHSGRLCLDFVATVGERWRRSFDRLRAPQDLSRWFVSAGLLADRVEVRPRELGEARVLREAIYRLAKSAASRAPDPTDVDVLNRWAAKPGLAPQLTPRRQLRRIASRPVQAALSTIARDAIDLLTGPLAGRVRECARPDCALLFVDTSRPGRRRWCSMESCGNKAKTSAYRARRRVGARQGSSR
jgi:predicted RNA-binding Zn ribbon-like protein